MGEGTLDFEVVLSSFGRFGIGEHESKAVQVANRQDAAGPAFSAISHKPLT
jgi:hypothetical protein